MPLDIPPMLGKIETSADDALIGSVLLITVTEERLRSMLRAAADGDDVDSLMISLIAECRPIEDEDSDAD